MVQEDSVMIQQDSDGIIRQVDESEGTMTQCMAITH